MAGYACAKWGGDFKNKDGVHVDAWNPSEKSKFGYKDFQAAFNENQNDKDIEQEVFTGKPMTSIKLDYKATDITLFMYKKTLLSVDKTRVATKEKTK